MDQETHIYSSPFDLKKFQNTHFDSISDIPSSLRDKMEGVNDFDMFSMGSKTNSKIVLPKTDLLSPRVLEQQNSAQKEDKYCFS